MPFTENGKRELVQIGVFPTRKVILESEQFVAFSVLEHSVLECSLFVCLFTSHLIHSLSQLHNIPFQMPQL